MIDSTNDSLTRPPGMERLAASDERSVETAAILEELLAQSILLRDLYKIARWQTSDGQLRRMHLLFEGHYKEQLHLVDVLIDRARMLGGAGRVLAGDFLKSTQLSGAVRGRKAPGRWVDELLDAHELVLNTAQPARATQPRPWAREFAVGLVVLTNEKQSAALSEEWLRQTHRRRSTSECDWYTDVS